MGLFKKLFGGRNQDTPNEPEHAVIVRFSYGETDLQPLYDIEDKLEAAIAKAGAGEFDGNEVAMEDSDSYLYMYGPNADLLFNAVRPVLESSNIMKGATVTLQYGPPGDGVEEKEIKIGN